MKWHHLSFFLILLFLLNTYQQLQASFPTKRANRTPPIHLVKTMVANPEPLSITTTYTGSLRARRFVRIFTQEEGRITYLPYYEGDVIKDKIILIQLDDALLTAELNKAIATHKYARVNRQRLQRLAQQKIISADELARAQTELDIAKAEEQILRTRLSYTKILAPFAGIISTRLVELGDVIAKNTHILTVIDPTSLIIEVDIPERFLAQLKSQNPVSVQIDALGIQVLPGAITRIHPTINAVTRLGKIEVALRSLPKGIREGQFCRITIETQLSPRLTLPYAALRRDHDGEYVFIVNTEQKAQRQTVRSGQRLANKVEIVEGLKKGQSVIIKGFLGLQVGKVVQTVD